MSPIRWFRRQTSSPRVRPPARPRLLALEDRLAPATLDLLAGGNLVYAGANVDNTLTFSSSAGNFVYDNPLDPITLGAGAIAAGYTVSGGGATAMGPAAAASGLVFGFGTATNTALFGTFDQPIDVPLQFNGSTNPMTVHVTTATELLGGATLTGIGSLTIAGPLTVTGTLVVRANAIDIQSDVTASTRAVFAPTTNGRSVNLGTEVAASLSLTDAELDLVSAGTLQIGDPSTGPITISQPVSPANTSILSLATGIDINQTATGLLAVANLAMRAGFVNLGNGNSIGALAASVQDDLTLSSQSPLSVTAVDGLTGVASTFGGIAIRSDQLEVLSAATAPGTVHFAPLSMGRPIDLGGPDSPTHLGLTDAELDRVNAELLIVGDASAGSISVTAPITQAGSGYLTLSLASGDAIASAGGSIAGNLLELRAATGIQLATDVFALAFFNAASGVVDITNGSSLSLLSLGGTTQLQNNGTTTTITANGILQVISDVISVGTITFTTIDAPGQGQEVQILGSSLVMSSTGDIVLRAGDNILIQTNAIVQAAGTISLVADFGDADPGLGATVSVAGASLAATSATLTGGADDDIFNLSPSPSTPIAVNGGGGNNSLNFDALGLNTIVTAATITAAGLQPVAYSAIANVGLSNSTGVTIQGTAGDDGFLVTRSTNGVLVALSAGPTINVGELATVINGLGGTNSLTFDFGGGSPFPAGGLSINNISLYTVLGTAGDDVLDLQSSAGLIQFRFNNGGLVGLPGATAFRFNGLAGNDTFRAFYSGGDPVPVGGATFDGGAGDDALGVFGAGNVATYRPSATTPGDGTIAVDSGTIAFLSLTPVDITGMGLAIVSLPGGDDVLAVDNGFDFTNGGATPAIRVSGTSGGVAIETAALWNNTSVRIDTQDVDGNDAITVNSATVGNNTNLTIVTGGGSDNVTVAPGLGVSLAGQFEIGSGDITVLAPLTSSGAGGGMTFTNSGLLTVGGVAISSQGQIVQNGAGAVSIIGNATVTTNAGTISIQGPVTFAAGVNASFASTGNGAITFQSTLDGNADLSILTGGAVTFGGAVGAATPLLSLFTDSGGSTAVNGGLVRTVNGQQYSDDVTVTGPSTDFVSTNAGAIAFGQFLNGASAVTVTTAGFTLFDRAVGGVTPLDSLTVDGGGFVSFVGGLVRTTGEQTYLESVFVGMPSANFVSLGNAPIFFGSSLNGSQSATVNTGGLTTFMGPIGNTQPLVNLTVTGGGTTAINGGLVITRLNQTFNDDVVLGAASTQFLSTMGGTITFNGTLDGASAVSITALNMVAFFAPVGATTPLTSLNVVGGPIDLNSGSVTTVGDQSYVGPVILTADTVLNGVNISFSSTVDSDGTPRSLLVNGSGVTTFGGAVGGTSPLAALTTDGLGSTRINGGAVTTTGSQTYGDPVTLSFGSAGATTTTLTANAAGPGGITFASTLNGATPRNQALNLIANAGDIHFNGVVGGTTELGIVTIGIARNVTIAAAFNAASLFQTTGTGTTAFNGPTTLSSTNAFNITNAAISVNSTLVAPTSGSAGRLNATAAGVSQPAGAVLVGAVVTPESGRDGMLVLNGSGGATLNQPGNDVGFLTAIVNGPITFRDANDLTIVSPGLSSNNNAITLTTGRNFTAINANFATPFIDAGAAILQVNPGVAAGAVVTLNAEIRAGTATFGTDLGAPLSNALPDLFLIRPSRNVGITVKGNRPSPLLGDPIPPGDGLQPNFAGIIGRVVLTPTGVGQGVYTFPDDTVRPLTFFEIENLVGFSTSAYSIQTGPTTYGIRTVNQQLGTIIQGGIEGGQVPANPFVVAPAFVNPFGPFGAPRIAFGDVNGDGTADLIIANGPNNAPLVTVINGTALLNPNNISLDDPANILTQFFAYDPAFAGGLFIAAGDFDGDGRAEIVTGPDVGGGPHVRILEIVLPGDVGFIPGVTTIYNNVRSYQPSAGAMIPADFNAYDPSFIGGVRIAVGDVNADGRPDVVTGAGPTGGPHVKVFSGATGGVIRSFFAYAPTFTGGVYVGAGDYNQDGFADILTGAGNGGAPHVEIFSGASVAPTLLASFFAFDPNPPPGFFPDPNANTGVGSVAFTDIDGDGQLDILVGTARGPQARVLTFRGPGFTPILVTPDPLAVPLGLRDGVNVAGNAVVISGP